jgi:hypothetical protein
MLFAPNIEYVLTIMSGDRKVKTYDEFQGHHTNQTYYKSDIISPEYHEIKGLDGELWLRVKLE